jgi:hypothetical protein
MFSSANSQISGQDHLKFNMTTVFDQNSLDLSIYATVREWVSCTENAIIRIFYNHELMSYAN